MSTLQTAEKRDLAGRESSIINTALQLFRDACSKEFPANDDEAKKILDKCFSFASLFEDMARDRIAPFL